MYMSFTLNETPASPDAAMTPGPMPRMAMLPPVPPKDVLVKVRLGMLN
ncbi:MAG: hypothetical protein WDM81_08005 [Rhizomicrobium sp.]